MEENFDYDTDIDEEREVKKKKLAKKEEVAKAKNFLEETKRKYYAEIKLRPGVTQDQQKAMDFFNRYNKQQEVAEQQHELFKQKTKDLFNDDFEGFDIKVGDKRYKYNVVNRDKVAESQSNITNLVGKFLDSEGNVEDAKGYHKAIYAAENVDKIAAHFYEQGKADAVKDVINKSKNLSDTEGRKSQGDVFIGGYYMNNHHYVIPARWKNGNRTNLSLPSGGDGEVVDVKIYNGNPYYFGFSMAPNNMTGYLPKASYWKVNTRNDMPNGGGWQKGIYGGESYGGFVDETGVYVAGKIDWMIETENGNDIPGTGGTYAHYWHDGTKFDLPGGVFNNMWVSTAYDVAAADGFVVVAGDVATETQTQVPAIWVDDFLTKLEGNNTHGVAKAVFID